MFTRVLHRSSQVKHDDAGGGRGSRSGRRSCPRSPARRLMQMVRYGQPRRHRTPQEADSRQPGDEFDAATEPGGSGRSRACYCCRCAGGGGGGGRLTTLVDGCAAMSAADRCRLPRCKWWKSVCTRVYLISVNLASFVSFFPFFTELRYTDSDCFLNARYSVVVLILSVICCLFTQRYAVAISPLPYYAPPLIGGGH